jgi:AraC family transcriptional regulator
MERDGVSPARDRDRGRSILTHSSNVGLARGPSLIKVGRALTNEGYMERSTETGYVRRVEPLASNWRSACWGAGSFDTGKRPATDVVEGTIRTPHHMLLVNIRGGAEHLEATTDCGHRYVGPDRPGAVSFVPGNCERRLRLLGVRSEWASVSLRPELFDRLGAPDPDGSRHAIEIAAFTNVEDSFLSGAVSEFWRLLNADGSLDPVYAETLSLAMAHYLARRFGTIAPGDVAPPAKLAPWQVRRVTEFVEAAVGADVRIADLAALVGVSVGHFHRAFRATTGRTPLAYVNEARVRRALSIMAVENISVTALALRVGFLSPSHFTRIFRRVTGQCPSDVRRD